LKRIESKRNENLHRHCLSAAFAV